MWYNMDKGKTTKIMSGGAYIGKDGKRHQWSKIHGYKPKKITDDNWMEYGMPADEETNESKNMNRKLIRLTENDLHRIVKKSVNKAINEMYQKEFEPIYYQVEQAYYSLDKACTTAKKMYGEDIIVDKLNSALDELSYVYHICRQRQEIGD